MKRLIGDLYRILYRITGNKYLSLGFSVVYFTGLTLVIVYGLSFLLKGWAPGIPFILKRFAYPDIIFIGAALLFINFRMMLPLHHSKEKRNPILVTPIIVYSLVSVLLLLYTKYSDKLF